jgi:citrate lyase subunit beta/citryl-CoA lyase
VSARSYLYVPGNRPKMMAKAAARGADALILDLEDAVPASEKADAREQVVSFLRQRARERPEVWVRLNTGELLADDVAAITATGADGVSLPKVSSSYDLERLDELLGPAGLAVAALIESAAGVLSAPAIARAPRVVRLAIGEADLRAELGVDPSEDERELAAIRTQIVLASAAAGIEPPIGPVSTDFTDLDAFRRSTEALRRLGFGARATIHPAQVGIVNEAFTPTAAAIAQARRLVDRYESSGGGVLLDDEGRMVDEAVVRAARRTLSLAGEQPTPGGC